MAGHVHGERDGQLQGFANLLQVPVDAPDGGLVFHPAALPVGGEYGQQVGRVRMGILVHHLLHAAFPADAEQLAGLAPAVTEDAVLQVGLQQVGHVDEGHAAGVEAEEEHVAGIVTAGQVGQVQFLDLLEMAEGDRPLHRLSHAGVDAGERVVLLDGTPFHGPVVGGPQDAHVEGNGVHGHAVRFQVGFVCLQQFGSEVAYQDLTPVAETHEAVQGRAVGLARACLSQCLEIGDDVLHQGRYRQLTGTAFSFACLCHDS